MIKYFIKQFGGGKSFLLSVGILYLFLFFSAWEDIGSGMDTLLLLQVTNELGVAILLRPIAAALPISFFLMREWGSSYYQMVLSRSSCVRYAVSKVVCAYFIGFAVPFLADLLLLFTAAICSPTWIFGSSLGASSRLFPTLLVQGKPFLALLLYVAGFSLAGSIWSVLIVGVSVFTTNGYVLVAAPFLLERVFSYVLQFIGRKTPFVLCFDTSHSYAFRIDHGLELQFAYSLFLCVAVGSLVFLATKRRRHHG